MHEPVELIDDDLDIVAGGTGGSFDINIADVDQYIRQVQIVLCRNGPAKSENGDIKNKRRKRDCFHNCGVNPSQIFGTPLPDN